MHLTEIYTDSFELFLGILFYVIRVYPNYVMAKRAGLKNAWMMCTPILGELQILHLAELSF